MNTTTVVHVQQIETWAEYYLSSNVLSLVQCFPATLSLVFICRENPRPSGTITDFADISDMHQRSVPDFPDYELFICDRGTVAQQFRGFVMSEIADRCRCPGQYKFEFSFVGNDR